VCGFILQRCFQALFRILEIGKTSDVYRRVNGEAALGEENQTVPEHLIKLIHNNMNPSARERLFIEEIGLVHDF
jgi:hypothetical protein